MRILLLSLFLSLRSFAAETPDSVFVVNETEMQVLLVTGSGDLREAVAGTPATADTTLPPGTIITAARQTKENQKLVAALLALPPFGMLGLHRIYLGTKPYVPVIYLVTLGGGLGILPLIDCAVILISEKGKLDEFRNNPKIFMWLK